MSLPYEIRGGIRDRMHGYVHQADAVLNQPNPVSATLYTVLATTQFVRIISAGVMVTWTVQPTPVEIVVTIDGIAEIFLFANPVSAAAYFANAASWNAAATQALSLTDYALYRTFLREGKSIKIEARTTDGTVQNLSARVKWAQRQVYQ